MADLTVLHFTDLGEEYDRLAVIQQFAQRKKGEIDAIFFTGDFIEGNPQEGKDVTANRLAENVLKYLTTDEFKAAHQALTQFVQQYATEGNFYPGRLGKEEQQKWQQLQGELNKAALAAAKDNKFELRRDLVGIIEDSYKRLAAEFGKFPCPVYATMGDHDFSLGYGLFGDKVIFVDKVRENAPDPDETQVIITKSGRKFTVKGDLNTWEIPPFYTHPAIQIPLENYFVDYASGYSAAFVEQAIAQAQNDEEKAAWVQQGGNMREYQRGQEARLGSPQEVDLYLTHKLPHNDAGGTQRYSCITGDIALKYSAQAKAVYGGHFHDGQLGRHSDLEKWLAQEIPKSSETVTVDSTPVPVIYLESDEPWEINSGTQYFTVTEYNAAKEVETVTIYEFVYE